jgi:hypothetical protein
MMDDMDRLLNEYTGVLVCPQCGSHAITATRDASFSFNQRREGDTIIREKGYVSLFDNMLDAECLDCHTTSGTNGDGPGSEWWEE